VSMDVFYNSSNPFFGRLDAPEAPRLATTGYWIQPKHIIRIKGQVAGDDAKMVAESLTSHNEHFLIGALFDNIFVLSPRVLPDPGTLPGSDVTTIAAHSRHILAWDEGTWIDVEKKCIQTILKRHENQSCAIMLMSDRVRTIEMLTEQVQTEFGCTAVTANHSSGQGINAEHGPFAGMGFFQGLALVTTARHGFIANQMNRGGDFFKIRTSSALLLSIITYRLFMESDGTGRIDHCARY
jgi:hypothetical protein